MRGGVLTAASPRTPDGPLVSTSDVIPGSTDLRAAVLAVLREQRGPINVYALLAIINQRTGTRRHANSIYRILSHLVASDLAFRVVSWKRYMDKPPGCGPTPLLLLCRTCKGAQVATNVGIEQDLARLTTNARFTRRETHLEITGTCRRCLML